MAFFLLPLYHCFTLPREFLARNRKEHEGGKERRERNEGEGLRENFSASRPLRISFAVTDIRHGQRSSSNGRRRNREMKKRKRQKHKTSKKATDTLDMHAGHIFRLLPAFFSLLVRHLFLFIHIRSLHYRSSRRHFTSRKKMRVPTRVDYFYSTNESNAKQTPTPFFPSGLHLPFSAVTSKRDLERSSTKYNLCDSLLRNTSR